MRKASPGVPEQGTQTPSPSPDLIPAEAENQPRTHITIGTAKRGPSQAASFSVVDFLIAQKREEWERSREEGLPLSR
jgi:hypothetical protein